MGGNSPKQLSNDERDALFRDWSDDRASRTRRPLSEWILAHPEAADDLLAWTVDEPVVADAESVEPDPSEASLALNVGLSALAEMRSRMIVSAHPPAITSLISGARAAGFTPSRLASHLDVGLSIVAKLQQRLVRAATVPDDLIRNLAAAIKADAQQIRDYLALPPTLAAGSEFKASGVPRVGDQQDFEEAVETCLDMTPEAKARWKGM